MVFCEHAALTFLAGDLKFEIQTYVFGTWRSRCCVPTGTFSGIRARPPLNNMLRLLRYGNVVKFTFQATANTCLSIILFLFSYADPCPIKIPLILRTVTSKTPITGLSCDGLSRTRATETAGTRSCTLWFITSIWISFAEIKLPVKGIYDRHNEYKEFSYFLWSRS